MSPPLALAPRWPLTFKLGHEHLQAADTAREQRLDQRLSLLGFESWGVTRMRPDEEAFERGLVAVDDFVAVLPTGEVVTVAHLEIPWTEPAEAVETTVVYLAIPDRVEGAPRVGEPGEDLPFVRGTAVAETDFGSEPLTVATMDPCVRLALHTPPEGRSSFPLFRVSRVSGRWRFDLRVTPPSSSLSAMPAVLALVADVLARIDVRLRELRDLQRWDGVDLERFDPSDAPVVWLSATLARMRPRLAHAIATPHASPATVLRLLRELRGALVGVHNAPEKVRPGAAGADSWDDLAEDLRVLLGLGVPTPLEVVPLERTDPFLYRATVDRAVLEKPLFLAASAPHDLQVDDSFAALAKVGTSAVVAHAARTAVTGVPLALAHELPSVLPRRSHRLYYRLDTTSPAWAEIVATGDFAVYLPPREPALELSLFVVR